MCDKDDQEELFEWASLVLRPRNSDPDTSKQAFEDYDREKMSKAAACVVNIYREHGKLADYEFKPLFDKAWGYDCSFHLYRQARSVARDMGKITDTGLRRVNPETNRHQIVWTYVDGNPLTIRKCPMCGHVLRREEGSPQLNGKKAA